MRYYLLNLYLGRVLIAVLADALCFMVAAAATWFLLRPDFPLHEYVLVTLAGVFATFVTLYYTGGYGLTSLGSGRRTIESVFGAMGIAFVVALAIYFTLRTPPRAMEVLAHTAAIYFPLLLGERSERRPAEKLGQALAPLLGPVLRGPLAKYRAVPADEVAAALVTLAQRPATGVQVHHLPLE